ncbi:MAG: hypothetical protein QOJ92_2125 [Frankiales bacterium]|nr:hypothetical protein [Frankiales bacterium]
MMGAHGGKKATARGTVRRLVPVSKAGKVLSTVLGITLAGGTAYAATAWVVGLNTGSSGAARSASISNLTITAVAAPSASNLLYPGATGDVVVNINNPNPFPVTITAFQLPTNTTYATGYSDSALSSAVAGCSSSTSLVGWNFATSSSGSTHTLTSPMTVAASTSNFTVTLTNDATMASGTPLACANTYFSMPALTGVAASGGAATTTASGGSNSWTS